MHASYKIQLNYRTDGKNLPDNEKGKERMKKKYLSIILAMAAATTMFTGSALNVNAKSGDSSEIHVVRATITSFDPWEGYDNFNIYYQLYDQLVSVDENGDIQPDLAESWEVSDDGTEYTFKLRQDVKFTNGDPMTAEDVAWSINQAIASPNISALTTAWKSAEVVDDYTVKITLDYGYTYFLQMLSTSAGSICNKDVVEAAGGSFSNGIEGAGTGAYKIKEFVSGSHLTLEANQDYYKTPADFETVVMDVITDPSTASISLQSGDVDYNDLINFTDVEGLKATEGIDLIEQDEMRTVYLMCNLSDQNGDSPIANENVREAISYAVNRQDLKDYVYEGAGCLMSSLNYSTWPGYDDEPQIERNLEKAKQLMEEAGYGDGCNLSLIYNTEYLSTFPDVAVLVQNQLAEIGINLEINPCNASALTDQVMAGTYGDLFLNANGCFNDPLSWYDYLMSSEALQSTNFSYWSSDTVDDLIVKGRTSKSDEEVAAVLDDLREELWKEWPVIPLCSSGMRYAAYDSTTLTGCRVDFDFDYELYNWKKVN